MLNHLQGELESIYGIELGLKVEDFLVGEEAFRRLRPGAGAKEELLVMEEQGELQLGLFLAPELWEALLARQGPLGPEQQHPLFQVEDASAESGGSLGARLGPFTTVLEGVSHFVYLAYRAARDEAVSLLELELQAELDKFATSLLRLWRLGKKSSSSQLRRRLFDQVSYRSQLSSEESSRYQTANLLARNYCRRLEARFLSDGNPEELLRELRRMYRLSGAQKRAHLRCVAAN